MIFYYLDASAWVKRYYQEAGTDWVRDLFARHETIACSSLGLVEVMATSSRKRKTTEISDSQFKQKAQEIEDDWERFVKIHITTETINDAKELTKRHALRGADAIHLSSALILKKRLREKEEKLIVVASDNELKEAAKLSGLEVIDPAEKEPSAENEI